MSKTLGKHDFKYLNNLIDTYQVEGAISVYTYLLNQQGADYAGWARGVASGDAITGQASFFSANELLTLANLQICKSLLKGFSFRMQIFRF